MRIGVSPLKWERAALVGLHRMNAAAVVVRQVHARLVRTALQDQRLAIWRDLRLAVDELLLGHPKERGDAPHLVIANPHDSVLNPAARPAATAFEICSANLHRLLLAGCTLPELPGYTLDEKTMFGETSRTPEPMFIGWSHR